MACALATEPKFVVCDEPTLALDVCMLALVLNLMSDCRAWNHLASNYLRASGQSFRACYDATVEATEAHGWGPMPSYPTMKRRVDRELPTAVLIAAREDRELPTAVLIAAREGMDAATRPYPAQTQDRSHFHAMEAVNSDGHVFDVFVKWEDGSIGRPALVGFQDLYSGFVLSHRISQIENKETVRLAIADMIESWGIPEHVYFDNGRAFMSKWITGGMKTRFRLKVKDEEPEGVLTKLGVKVHAVRPYSGQSKPIERAWRDMVDRI